MELEPDVEVLFEFIGQRKGKLTMAYQGILSDSKSIR